MKKWWLAAFAAVCVAGGIGTPYFVNGTSGMLHGLTVDGTIVSGMSRSELVALLSEKNKKTAAKVLPLTYKTVKENWSFGEFSVGFDAEKEADRLMQLGRSGNILSDLEVQWRVLLSGGKEDLAVTYNKKALDLKIADMVKRYSTPPEEPKPEIDDNGIVKFKEGKPYLKIDAKKLAEAADAYIRGKAEGNVVIPVTEEKLSAVTPEMTKEINRVLGVYTTYFGGSENRCANIAHAASMIEAKIVKPGEDFSFNATTGLRTRENGYLDAPVFLDGKLVPDAGGGVCQVSSTLFAAVLRAGLAVTSRTCHFAPVAYIPIGQDATVADNYLDFCFRNHLKKPVYIHMVYEPGAITAYVLGNEVDVPAEAAVYEISCETIPNKKVFKTNPAQNEEVLTEEGNDGYDVVVCQSISWADGRTYQDSFRSVYDAVDDVITYKDAAKMKAAEDKALGRVPAAKPEDAKNKQGNAEKNKNAQNPQPAAAPAGKPN